jgi:hypothetical protein
MKTLGQGRFQLCSQLLDETMSKTSVVGRARSTSAHMISNDDELLLFEKQTDPFDRIPSAVAYQWPSIDAGIGHDNATVLGQYVRRYQSE